MTTRRAVSTAAGISIGLFVTLTVLVVLAGGLELLLRVRSRWNARTPTTRIERMEAAYAPCNALYLHPQYLLFFRLDASGFVNVESDICHVDRDGFRGPGPAQAGGRKLAFLMGASSAFGLFASSDATTITGYLNREQDQYFFVNAAVPGWNSTQEMFRVAFQVLEYQPALIVTYDGPNDADDVNEQPDSPGTPVEFQLLLERIEQRRSSLWPALRALPGTLVTDLFPEITARVRSRLAPPPVAAEPQAVSAEDLGRGVDRYLRNLRRIHEMSVARGSRFVAVFQPIAGLHRRLGPGRNIETPEIVSRFHDMAIRKGAGDFERLDFGAIFDADYDALPVLDGDITPDTVFVDFQHTGDRGNELAARHLAVAIR